MQEQSARADDRPGAFVQFYRWVFGIGHERNVGGTKRTVRYLLGGVFLLATICVAVFRPVSKVENAVLAGFLGAAGLYTVYEAQVQYCPLNRTIGRSTYREE